MCRLIENVFVKLMKNYNSGFYSIKKLIKLMFNLIENFFVKLVKIITQFHIQLKN